jgi:hypothetical protein
MAESQNLFDHVDEPVQVRRLKQAGVHRRVRYNGLEFLPAETKKGENGKADTELSARATFKFLIQHEVKEKDKVVIFQELLFEEMRFCPPTKEEDVKYLDDKYQNNVKVGKKTPKEQMQEDWERLGMFLCQLGAAFGVQFTAVKTRMAKYFKGYTEASFKSMIEGFNKEFPPEKLKEKGKFIDIKCIWTNNKEKRTSFLRMARPSASNLAFAEYKEGQESQLFLNEYETKNLKALYTGQDNPPASNEEVIDESKLKGGANTYVPPVETTGEDLLEGTGLEDQSDLF